MQNQNNLAISLYQIGAIKFGEFTLKSGLKSSIYMNLRIIISYPDVMRAVAAAMWDTIKNCQFDLICGVPYTALPIATCISLDHNIPMIMRRKEKKDYGTKQSIEGEFKSGQRCLIIEDVITTGGSIIETADDLKSAGIQINDVIALVDREQGGKENLSKHFQAHTVLTLSGILKELLQTTLLKPTERPIIEKFLLETSVK